MVPRHRDRNNLSWVKLDDVFPDHPKVVGLSVPARWAYIAGLCYCARYLTNGAIPERKAREFGASKVARELVEAGLWDRILVGFQVHDYLDYNPDRDSVLTKRAADSARKRGGVATDSGGSSRPVSSNTRPDPDPITEDVLPFEPESSRKRPLSAIEPELPALRDEFPNIDVNGELVQFRDHIKAKSKTYTDYVAAFRNWLRNERKWSNGRTTKAGRHTSRGNSGGASASDILAGWEAEAARKG